MRKLLFLLLLIPSTSLGYKLEWGIGLKDSKPSDSIKYMDVSYARERVLVDDRLGMGFWFDKKEKSSLYLYRGIQIGPKFRRFYLSYTLAPCLISAPDNNLGSYFEILHKLSMDLIDSRYVSFGFEYTHISNAGLSQRNQGRDFIGFGLGF